MTAPDTHILDVFVHTYNHEKFIAQALESILGQKTFFPFRVLILDDFSTDNTREIVQEFAQKHPDKIKLRLHSKNLFSNRPLVEELSRSKARYIAIIDGDDYWTSTDKLQRQVEFLEKHSDCALCFHRAKIECEVPDPERNPYKPMSCPRFTNIDDLFLGNYIATCSAVYRKSALPEIPDWYDDVLAADWYLHLFAAQSGTIGFIEDVLGVYRIHPGGLWTRLGPVEKWLHMVKIHLSMLQHFDKRHHNQIQKGLVKAYRHLALAHAAQGDPEGVTAALQQVRKLTQSTGPLPEIVDNEPKKLECNRADHPPGGNEFILIRCRNASFGTCVVLNGIPLKTTIGKQNVLTAEVPDSFLVAPGSYKLHLQNEAGKSRSVKLVVHR